MTLIEDVALLRQIPLFSNIEEQKLKILAFAAERRLCTAEGFLFRQGDPGDAAYIIVSGKAEIIVESPKGTLVVAEIGPHDLVGEIAVLCDVVRTASVRARTDVEAIRISADIFYHLVKEFPDTGIEIMRALALRLENTTQALSAARAELAPTTHISAS